MKLVLPGRAGYPIWGGNFDGARDEFLADDGLVLLYPDRKTMCRQLDIERPDVSAHHPRVSAGTAPQRQSARRPRREPQRTPGWPSPNPMFP
ncbi:hypothetical protein [Paractinoplanes ferrugineus]|uniref:hypothetical protein n=1 Tax=Paractinoplanes ferrugineus TaxID=113564 RepID=UPI001940404B|nr:hypothetical protein [Actinoplanes ferrugineus]